MHLKLIWENCIFALMLNLIIFGPPGAGKGTQSANLIEEFGLRHISTGDLLRAEREAETELGMTANEYISQGQLVPDEVVIGMVSNFMDSHVDDCKGFIFDGFPRTIPQADALDHMLEDRKTRIAIVLGLEVDEDELVKRLLLRGKESGREDDQNEETIRSRFGEYNAKTQPLISYYKTQDKYTGVHGMGSIDHIFSELKNAIYALNGSAGL
jgi:adenylate kinase